jgi:hypothetical protein
MDITSIESAFLRGKVRFEDWVQKYEAQMFAPRVRTEIAMLANELQGLPPEIQEQSRARNPDAWKNVDRFIRQIERGKNG